MPVRGPTLLLALLAAGCGARPATHGDFERLQIAEATLDRASYVAHDPDADCEARCEAAQRMRRAAEDACAIAGEVEDADAHARCEAAGAEAREGTGAARTACGGCPPDGERP